MTKICWFLAVPLLAFAQFDDNTITVTASRQFNLQPDQVVIGVNVYAVPTVALDDVVAALTGSGITAANLSYVYTFTGQSLPVEWTFTLAVSFASLKATLASLASAQLNAAKGSIMQVTYYIQYAQVSDQLQAANPCPFPALVADAQTQAQKTARAMGLKVGAVLAISDSSSGAIGYARAGDFSQSLIIYDPLSLQPAYTYSSPTCSMTVQFQLIH